MGEGPTEGWKTLTVGHSLKVISRIQEKTLARNFCSFSSEALRLQLLYSRPCARPAHMAESWPRAGLQVLQNRKSDVHVKS